MSADNVLPHRGEKSTNILTDSFNSVEGINSLTCEPALNINPQNRTPVANDNTPQNNARLFEEDTYADDNTETVEQGAEDQTGDSVYSDTSSLEHVRNNSSDLTDGDDDDEGEEEGDTSCESDDLSNNSVECNNTTTAVIVESGSREYVNGLDESDSNSVASLEHNQIDKNNIYVQSDRHIVKEAGDVASLESRQGVEVELNESEPEIDVEDASEEDEDNFCIEQVAECHDKDTPDDLVQADTQEKNSDVVSFESVERVSASDYSLGSASYNSHHTDSGEDIGSYLTESPGLIQSRASTAHKEKKSVSFNETVGFISLEDSTSEELGDSEAEQDTTGERQDNLNTGVHEKAEVEIENPDSPTSDPIIDKSSDEDDSVIEYPEKFEADPFESESSDLEGENVSYQESHESLKSLDENNKEDNNTEQLSDQEYYETEKNNPPKEYNVASTEKSQFRDINDTDDDYSIGTFETESVTSLLDRIDAISSGQDCVSLTETTMEEDRINVHGIDNRKTYPYSHEIKTGCQNVYALQKTLSHIFHNSATLLQEYKTQLTTEQLKDFALNLGEFRENFMALAELYTSCEKLSFSMNKELKEIRRVTDDVCNLINRKFRDEDLITWIDHDEDEYLDKERLEEERIAANKSLLAKAADARASSAKAATIASETDKIIADTEAEAAEAELAAKRAREVAQDALQAAEDAARAAEERKKAEDEAKRRAEEKARIKAEEEKKKREEEDRRLEEEAKRKGTSLDVERSLEEEERARREAERKNPNNWPRYIYSIEPGDFDPGLGCIVRAINGSLHRDDLEVQRIDQMSGVFHLCENEELISNIIEVKQTNIEKNLTFEEPFSLVIPHCSPRVSQGREPVVKWYDTSKEEWTELPTNDAIIEDIKDVRFVEARGMEFGLFAVVYRLKRENFTFTKKGGKLSSTVDTRFTMTTKPGAFRYNVGITTEIQPVDTNTVSELRHKTPEECGSLMASTPIIKVKWTSTRKLPKPVSLTLPCPPNPSRVKRPSTAITRDKMIKVDMRPQTARSLSGYVKKEDDSKHDEELHLVCKDENGLWVKVQDVALVQAKNKDLVSFDMTQPMDRFVVLRTKLELADYQVEKMATRLEKVLLQRNIQVFLRQRGEDLNDILVSCASTNKVERVLRRLAEDGFDEGPSVSKEISVKEGQVLEIRFRGNLGPDTKELRTTFPFNSHIPCRTEFRVEELDKFAQRSFNSYRGFCQVFTEGLVPKFIQDSDDRENSKSRNPPKNQPVRIEMVDGEILLCELLMTIPKPEPEPPKPLLKAPLSIIKEGPINEDVFRFISRELGDEWKQLAKYLNIRRMRIQAILRQNVNSERQQTIYDMLVSWAKRIPRAVDKVEMLCHALSVCGRGDLVEVLKERNAEFKKEMSDSARDSYLKTAFVKVSRDEKVSTDWKVLAKRLGLPDRTLREIEGSRPTRQDRCFSSLQKWRDMNADSATIPNLSAKLRECRYRGLAREIDAIG
ncbi:uncharacterized protein LOC126810860 [Patella vulgata]|uniref:uncharacterized protein LOC126810860 n=1 Tax=Patella vulgata TaxID=6465 RepID=UPI00217F3F1C|nr:uncharacterized protein LOC126810860 [Patella vulgata]